MTSSETFATTSCSHTEPLPPLTGTVFHGVHNVAGKPVAIKVEPALTDAHAASPLRQEARLYRKLMGGEGVPWAVWSVSI
jgi:hypothetical protein